MADKPTFDAGPFAAGPRLITRFQVVPSNGDGEYPDALVVQDDCGALWHGFINTHAIKWDRLPALPSYDEVPR